jgi:hypothetical protein
MVQVQLLQKIMVATRRSTGKLQFLDLLFVCALSRRAPDQRIIHALAQAANFFAVISLLIDFEIGPQKKLRCKLFDREPDRIRSVIGIP